MSLGNSAFARSRLSLASLELVGNGSRLVCQAFQNVFVHS
jgi:hypothetical protein